VPTEYFHACDIHVGGFTVPDAYFSFPVPMDGTLTSVALGVFVLNITNVLNEYRIFGDVARLDSISNVYSGIAEVGLVALLDTSTTVINSFNVPIFAGD